MENNEQNSELTPGSAPENTSSQSEGGGELQQKNKKMLIPLLAIAFGMLLFGVTILPWFYDLVCAYVGVDINPDNNAELVDDGAGNPVNVSFQARVLDDLPVRFYAEKKFEKIMTGESGSNVFHFENLSNETVYFRPLHTVSPSFAAAVFDMRVCFCFNDQALAPGEKKSYEIVYSFGTDLDARNTNAVVSYDLHKITKEKMKPFKPGNTKSVDPEKVKALIEEAQSKQ